MILTIPEYNITLDIKENIINVLCIENPETFSKLLSDITWYHGERMISLYDKDKACSFEKEAECILSPLLVDCNDKKIINKLFQYMKQDSTLFFEKEEENIKSKIIQYIEVLTEKIPFLLEHNYEIDTMDLLKICGLRVLDDFESVLERLLEYIRLKHTLCGVDIFVLVNIKQYLSNNEIEELYKISFYEKYYVVVIESREYDIVANEKIYILDMDKCLIQVN